MPAYKPPRPYFDRLSVQDYIKIFLANANNTNTFKTLSCVKPNSPLSIAVEAMKEHTNVPLQLPMIGFLHLVGTWLMKQESVVEVRGKKINPDLWTIALASSGAGKTFAFSQLQINFKTNSKFSTHFQWQCPLILNLGLSQQDY